MPMRLHERGNTSEGTLPFSSEFIRYVGHLECTVPDCSECRKERARARYPDDRNPESRLRATRSFRKLRRMAPREFDALYLYCINRYTVQQIATALTERAVRLGKIDRYDSVAVSLLLLSGIDKVIKNW